jgi:outer membrane protein OmpA-like peptidoglycan-associated protein
MSLNDNDYIKEIAEDVKENPDNSLRLIKRFLPLATMLLMASLLWLYFEKANHTTENEQKAAVSDNSIALDTLELDAEGKSASERWAKTLGENVELTLPNGEKLNVPSKGLEKQLFDYLNQNCPGDLKSTWFNYDRILFKSGSAELNSISKNQIESIAKLMKAFPATTFKIGGYTDNTGDLSMNKKLSSERAAEVAKALVANSATSANIASEGYGPEFPICPENDTEECKEKNRRVAMRVVKCK